MERKNVLELKIVKMNDEYSACTITKQDDDVIKRGEFEFIASNGLQIISSGFPEYSNVLSKILIIKGINRSRDNEIAIILNKDVPFIEKAVKELNKKYSIVKRWRARKGEKYYFSKKICKKNKKVIGDYHKEIGE